LHYFTALTRSRIDLPSKPLAERSFSSFCFSFCALASAQNDNPKMGSTWLPQAQSRNAGATL
jgi:hypothetical protein